ncbi:MAG: SCO family protein [Leptospirales bacterium]|jgi:protein SCO1/2
MRSYNHAIKISVFLALAALLIAMPAWISVLNLSPFHGRPIDKPAPAFKLVDFSGNPVGLENFRGRYVFLFFGYGNCGTICPRTLGSLAGLGQAEDIAGLDITIAFVSIDPRRDTQSRSTFARLFEETRLSFVALRGGDGQVRKVAADYGVFYDARADYAVRDDRGIQHPMIAHLIDPEGVLRLTYTSNIVPREVVEDLNRIASTFRPGVDMAIRNQ